ncbi:hypothetical protein [Clostridium sp.]|uniref:hypothetical protein n=1 Tax=Clostridium sp. TaxID=1506 RepID=UPI00283F24FB|nr:hypothetical protein [Clostridium sp.]MDR3596503.1 hypothetical protein [Clostridium sp.]
MARQLSKIIIPQNISKLNNFRKEKFFEVSNFLLNNKYVQGALLGGSLSYKDNINKSDIDLFCLLDDVHYFNKQLTNIMHKIADVDVLINQGSFPWTGNLKTIFYKEDLDFCIDICMVDSRNADKFFWEPNGFILFDKLNLINKYRTSQMSNPTYSKQPFLKSNPFSMAIHTLKKIDKNLSRGHLWNSLEQLNVLRRYVMQIIRIKIIKDNDFLGRVDRDIEEVLPSEINMQLINTVAVYDSKDITQKTIQLIKIIRSLSVLLKDSTEASVQDWVIKQLNHEEHKLLS